MISNRVDTPAEDGACDPERGVRLPGGQILRFSSGDDPDKCNGRHTDTHYVWGCLGIDAKSTWTCEGVDGRYSWTCTDGATSDACYRRRNALDGQCSIVTHEATDDLCNAPKTGLRRDDHRQLRSRGDDRAWPRHHFGCLQRGLRRELYVLLRVRRRVVQVVEPPPDLRAGRLTGPHGGGPRLRTQYARYVRRRLQISHGSRSRHWSRRLELKESGAACPISGAHQNDTASATRSSRHTPDESPLPRSPDTHALLSQLETLQGFATYSPVCIQPQGCILPVNHHRSLPHGTAQLA